jgi:hypothetical protein
MEGTRAETRSVSCDCRPHLISSFSFQNSLQHIMFIQKPHFNPEKTAMIRRVDVLHSCRRSVAEMWPSFKEINVDAMTPLTASLNRGSILPLALT